jgi:rubrerythrin
MEEQTPLEFALDFEINGAKMYLDFAVKTRNLLTKQLFYTLAKQEVDHAKTIEEFSSNIIKRKEFKFSSFLPSVEEELKGFFQKSKKINLKENVERIEGYTIAMEMERKGYKAYEDFYKKAMDESEKSFFKFLMREEKKHGEALANAYYFLTQTKDWIQEEEGKVWNWMNI